MDELKLNLSTKIMRGLVTKLIEKVIRDKCGYNVDIQLNELNVTMENGKAHLHTNVDLELDNNELMNLLKSII